MLSVLFIIAAFTVDWVDVKLRCNGAACSGLDAVCNAGSMALSLQVETADGVTFLPVVRWSCSADGVPLTESALSALLIDTQSSLSGETLVFAGDKLDSGGHYACEACIEISDRAHCASNTETPFGAMAAPAIAGVSVVSSHSDVFSMTDWVGFNVTDTTFDAATTTFSVLEEQDELSSGSIEHIAEQNIIFGHVGSEQLIRITVCGEDVDECRACRDTYVIVLRNAQMNDSQALCGAIANITASVMATNNTLLKFHATRIIVAFLGAHFCEDACLFAAFEHGFATALDLVAANQHNPEYVATATLSMAQFVARDECDTLPSNRSLERIQNAVEILASQVASEADAQSVLDVGNQLLSKSEQDAETVCSSLNFQQRIADSMLSKVVADSDSRSASLSGDVVCGVGISACSNCELKQSASDDACMPEIHVAAHADVASATQRQLRVVAVDAHYAQSCIENDFTRATGRNVSDYTKEFVLSSEFINITLLGESELADGETLVVTLPTSLLHRDTLDADGCPLGEFVVLFLNESNGAYSTDGITMLSGTTFESTHNSVFVAAHKIQRGGTENALGNFIVCCIAVISFLVLASYAAGGIVQHWGGAQSNRMSNTMRTLIAVICTVHVLGESASIVHYAPTALAQHNAAQRRCPESATDTRMGVLPSELLAFTSLLSTALHFWAVSVTIFSWLKIFWITTMRRSALQIRRFGKQMVAANMLFGAALVAVGVCITAIDDESLVLWMVRVSGIGMLLLNLVMALATLLSSHVLLNHAVRTARAVGRACDTMILRKLRITGIVCALCFCAFSLTTAVSVYDEELYLKHDAVLNAVVKLSLFVGLAVVLFMFSGTGRAGNRATQESSEQSGTGANKPNVSEAVQRKGRRRIGVRKIKDQGKREVAIERNQINQNIETETEEESGVEEDEEEEIDNESYCGECAQCEYYLQGKVDATDGTFYCHGCWENEDHATDWQMTSKSLNLSEDAKTECSQCFQMKREVDGQRDPEDESWYCAECCAKYEFENKEAPKKTS